jgi:hypothetical protein
VRENIAGWLVAGGWYWFVVREKYYWLVVDKTDEQVTLDATNTTSTSTFTDMTFKVSVRTYICARKVPCEKRDGTSYVVIANQSLAQPK